MSSDQVSHGKTEPVGELELLDAGVTAARGFWAAGTEAGVKKQGLDLALIYSEAEASAAAIFTTNLVKAAPILVTRENLQSGLARAVVVNSGNANACNGPEGLVAARRMATVAAEALDVRPERVAVASTGVIGKPLPLTLIETGIHRAARELATSREAARAAAMAIMTTDTRPKEAAVRVKIGGTKVTVAGMAKGVGMIHPNLATMLAFIVTDANIAPQVLRPAFSQVAATTFNQITVDGDTSTNDMALVLANGTAGNRPIGEGAELAAFTRAMAKVCADLAVSLVTDGEGATKLIIVRVSGAATEEEARLAARAVAGSNLVKAAVFGADANWGRILCALGYSGAAFDPGRVNIFLEGGDMKEQVAAGGRGLAFNEDRARQILENREVAIIADLGAGSASATAWGCDLTYDYVKINAAYRT